jgi:hypothetical protein
MPWRNEKQERNLIRKEGFKRYAATFSWPQKEDKMAAKKLLQFHLKLDKDHNIQHPRGYYLNGKYRMIVIGLAKDYKEFGALCEVVTRRTQIDYEISEAIDIHSLAAHATRILAVGKGKAGGEE